MPKPFTEYPGSGMHTHMSLFEGDRNAFYEAGRRVPALQGRPLLHRRPAPARRRDHRRHQPVGQLLQAAGAAAGEAPSSYICWGHNNRSALVRVPMYKPHKGGSTRVEVRSLDSACNPYLAFAVMLAAGLKGIEEGYELPAGAEDDVWALTERRAPRAGHRAAAAEPRRGDRVMERSELVAETLGEHVFDFFLRNKRAEWEEYRSEVTAFELRKSLPVL